jgi:ATP-dependent Lon protease
MFDVGCVSTILQMLKLPDGTVKVLVEGQQRASVNRIEEGENPTSPPTSRPVEADAEGSAWQGQRDRGPAPRGDAAV